jgi:hypothetical protein
MRLQTRKRIFYVFLLLFIVIGAFVVLYAEGWRLNFSTLEAEKAGGIYVRSYPENAAITLGGKPYQNQSAFLSSGTFISGLVPKTYVLKLTDAGYDAWTEDAQVVPSLVTEMKYAVLVPDAATTVATSGPASAFFEVNGDAVTQSASGTILWRGTVIGRGAVVSHSTDLKIAIIRSVNAKTGAVAYSLYDFTAATSTSLSTVLQLNGVKPASSTNIFIDPSDDTGIFVQTSAKIVEIDADTEDSTAITTAPTGETVESPIAISPSLMAWTTFSNASDTSRIVVYDKFSGNTVDSSRVVPGAVKQLAWVKNGVLGVLESNNSLYLYNVSAEQLTPLASDVKQFYPTADGAALAALEYNSLEVFSFNSQPNYYRFNLPAIGSVQGLMWYKDETHLFVEYPGSISFLDFADADLKNLTTVSPGTDASYDQQENSLYLLDAGQKLVRFDFPQ